MNKTPVLELLNINKSYKQGESVINILKDVNLKIESKAMIAIIGASGSGKSTLLHIAGLLDKSYSGKVIYAGVSHLNNEHKIRRSHIGFIYQYHHLLKDFNARENVALPLILSGENANSALVKADKLLNSLGLNSRLHNMPGELSGGEQQRVAIARSLINNPKVILADEPTGNLDPKTGQEVYEIFLNTIKTYDTSIVTVTHNHSLALMMDRIYKLKDQKLQEL